MKSLKKRVIHTVSPNKIVLVMPNNSMHYLYVNVNKNRRVNINNSNLTRNQMRQVHQRLSRQNLFKRVFYLMKHINNANSLEKFANAYRLAYPVNNPEAAPLQLHIRRHANRMLRSNIRSYKPYRNLQEKFNRNNITENEYIANLERIERNYNRNRRRIRNMMEY